MEKTVSQTLQGACIHSLPKGGSGIPTLSGAGQYQLSGCREAQKNFTMWRKGWHFFSRRCGVIR
jgi:hypothetical protein